MTPEVDGILQNCLVCMGGDETETIERVQRSLPYALECNIGYFAATLHELRRLMPHFDQYTFVFTRSVTELPTRFWSTDKLVVLVMGDEWARVPGYAAHAHTVFKAPGQHMKLALHHLAPRFNLMTLLQYLRQHIKRYPNHYRDTDKNLFAIPYGYYRLPERNAVTPINSRSIDVSFTGSIDHKKVLGGAIKTAKVLSRERMVETVNTWSPGKPYNIAVKLSSHFPKAGDKPQFDTYPQILMDTKICLSPRGTHLETYRLCEGMYYGCVVIAEEQPDHWFSKGSPAIILKDWNRLPALLDNLLGDPAQLATQQQRSLDYWDRSLAPKAIATYMQDCLNRDTPIAANDDQDDTQASVPMTG